MVVPPAGKADGAVLAICKRGAVGVVTIHDVHVPDPLVTALTILATLSDKVPTVTVNVLDTDTGETPDATVTLCV